MFLHLPSFQSSLHTNHTNTDRQTKSKDYPMPDGSGIANRDSLESIETLQARRWFKSVNVERFLTAGKDRHFFKSKLMEDFTKKLIEPHWMDVFVWGLLIVIAVYAFYLMFKINQTRKWKRINHSSPIGSLLWYWFGYWLHVLLKSVIIIGGNQKQGSQNENFFNYIILINLIKFFFTRFYQSQDNQDWDKRFCNLCNHENKIRYL